MIQNRLEQSSSFYLLLAHMDEKSKQDRKIDSVYVNCQFSVFPCWSRKWTETWSTGIPLSLSPCPPPLTQDPTVMGRAWQWAALCGVYGLCVRVCVLISCFIEEALFTCTDRYSDFHCEKKKDSKKKKREKLVSILMNLYGKQLALFLGSCPALSKNIFWFTGKVQIQCLNQALKSMSFYYSTRQKNLKHYKLLCLRIICSTFLPNLLITLRADWLDTESCGHYVMSRI